MTKKKSLLVALKSNDNNSTEQSFTLSFRDTLDSDNLDEYPIPSKFSKLLINFERIGLTPSTMKIKDDNYNITLIPSESFSSKTFIPFYQHLTSISLLLISFRPIIKSELSNVANDYDASPLKRFLNSIYGYPDITGYQLSISLKMPIDKSCDCGEYGNLFSPMLVHDFISKDLKKMNNVIGATIKTLKRQDKKSKKK